MWYYELNQTQNGPVDEAVVAGLLANGTLTVNTLVWREGLVDWVPLHQTELSRSAVTASAPPFPSWPGAQPAPYNPYQTPQAPAIEFTPGPAVELTWKQILWSFEGRIPRRTYWAGIGIWIGVIVAAMFVGGALGALVKTPEVMLILLLPLLVLYIWSALALQIKRWHDRNKSGAMVLINLIPYVGGIWTFVECGCLRGTVGANSYGHDPT